MGLTERHWFEDEEPELTERQLEDIVYENKKAYDNGYIKGLTDGYLKRENEIVRCKDCKYYNKKETMCNVSERCNQGGDWFCADGERRGNE